jgi:hypothetical protein
MVSLDDCANNKVADAHVNSKRKNRIISQVLNDGVVKIRRESLGVLFVIPLDA